MTGTEPTWAVVATVDEHPAVLQSFVAWHLHLGAAAVYLYFDRPDDPAAALFDGVPSVHVVLCDRTHWQRLAKRRPDKHQIRQVCNANDAYVICNADWLLHCDADEYLWPGLPVSGHLASVYPWIDGAIVPVAERCFAGSMDQNTVFDGVFRRPVPGERGPAALSLRGLTGHAIGKTFARVGQGIALSIHRPKAGDPPLKLARVAGLELLHFDGLTRLQWIYKLLRKADAFANHRGMIPSPHRQMQIDAVLADPRAAFALHDRLKVLARTQVAALDRDNLLLRADFDPSGALMSVFGDDAILKPADFDVWLRAQKGGQFSVLHDLH